MELLYVLVYKSNGYWFSMLRLFHGNSVSFYLFIFVYSCNGIPSRFSPTKEKGTVGYERINEL